MGFEPLWCSNQMWQVREEYAGVKNYLSEFICRFFVGATGRIFVVDL